MTTTARLRAARRCNLRVQACLDRSAALRSGNVLEADAHAAWAELCRLRQEYWDSECSD